MPPALPVVRVTGPGQNVGKTWLASRLIGDLTARGYRVAAVKRSHHSVAPDRAGSDTDRFAQAGAASVLFCAADGTIERAAPTGLAQALDRYIGEADIAVVEGFKSDTLGAVIRLSGDNSRRARFEAMDGSLILDTVAEDLPGLVSAIESQFLLSAAGDDDMRADIRRAARTHGHLCAGIVLGVRMARLALSELGLPQPLPPHALRVTVEVARCATDAVASVTGCTLGRGNLRVVDHGKMAASFEDLGSGRAVRVIAREDTRDPDDRWASRLLSRQHRQAIAYRQMPDAAIFAVHEVRLLGDDPRRRERVTCDRCGETMRVAQSVAADRAIACHPCATGEAYYSVAGDVRSEAVPTSALAR